jgi:hypothetical protein
MRHFFVPLTLSLLLSISGDAQVKIGGMAVAPVASAVLELDGGSSRGLLLPRMRKLDIDAIVNPAEGLAIYATDEQAVYLRKSLVWEKQAPFSLPFSQSVDLPSNLFSVINWNDQGHGAIHGLAETGSGLTGLTYTGTGLEANAYSLAGVGGLFSNTAEPNTGRALIVWRGRTGIGTVDPEALLHVRGQLQPGHTIIIDDDDDPTIQFRKAGVNVGVVKNATLYMEHGNSEGSFNWVQSSLPLNSLMGLRKKSGVNGRGVLNVSTSVSIGNFGGEFPGASLHVRGTPGDYNYTMLLQQTGGDPIIGLQNDGLDKGYIQLVGNDMKLGTYANNDPGRVILRTNGFDRIWVDSVGYVTVGGKVGPTLSGPYKLAVRGKIAATEFNVVAVGSWPDYVFDDSYQLRSLEETEAYIKANKHLPNIPAAAVVEKEGYGLGDMQKRMMEKIEELTLYLIEANKEIQLLKKQMAERK